MLGRIPESNDEYISSKLKIRNKTMGKNNYWERIFCTGPALFFLQVSYSVHYMLTDRSQSDELMYNLKSSLRIGVCKKWFSCLESENKLLYR